MDTATALPNKQFEAFMPCEETHSSILCKIKPVLTWICPAWDCIVTVGLIHSSLRSIPFTQPDHKKSALGSHVHRFFPFIFKALKQFAGRRGGLHQNS